MSSPVMVPHRRRSLAGPIVLIVMGILFLLGNLRVITWPSIFVLFAHYWPLLLILWGGIKLYEYYQARNEGVPSRGIGAGGVFLLIFVILLGLAASAGLKIKDQVNWAAVRDDVQMDEDFVRLFGNDYIYEQQVEQDFPDNATLRIVSDRGSININVWDQKKIKVLAHKKIFAKEQSAADARNASSVPQLQVSGTSVVLNANTQGAGDAAVRADLDVWLPKTALLDIATRRGDVVLNSGYAGEVKISNSRGDVMVDGVKGNVTLNLERGSARVTKIDGNVTFQGRADDVDVTEVTGSVRISGDIMSTLKVMNIKKSVIFQSSRTDMEFASLEGDLTLDSGDLRGTRISGPVKLVTRSKDIHLEDVSGDIRLENNNGSVELHTIDKVPMGNIEISNDRGDIRLVVPGKATFQVNATTRRGEVQSDFSELTVNNQKNFSAVTGTVGKPTSKIQVTSDSGDIEIRKIS